MRKIYFPVKDTMIGDKMENMCRINVLSNGMESARHLTLFIGGMGIAII